ncbi:MAG: hypothetical protein IPK57_22040 [Chitinophagaceae bacterium]|nr:hypothetical protein [Chitinophagaceae bacterium]
MRYTIIKIEPFIHDRKQCVGVYLKERKDPVAFTYDYVFNSMWQIRTTELELLIDSYLEPIYFQKGETLRNGRKANSNNYHIKWWTLVLNGTQKEIREKNNSLCPIFQTLYDTYIFKRKDRDVVRIRSTCDKVYFVDLKELERVTGLKQDEFDLLTGAFISPTYYKAGEVSEKTGWIVYEDDKIVKDLNLRVVRTIDFNSKLPSNQKLELTSPSIHKNFHNDDYDGHYDRHEYDDNSRPSYEKYNGYNGFDDDTIDQAFEGDPEATWNVD